MSDYNDLLQLAQTKYRQGDIEGAMGDLNRLVAHCPDNETAHNDLGALNYEIGHMEKAQACYEKAVRLAPDNATFRKNLADLYWIEQGRTEDAMKLYLRVLQNNPQDVECLLAIGWICNSMNQISDARSFFQRVIDIEPWNHSALNAMQKIDGEIDASTQTSSRDCGCAAHLKASGCQG